MAMAPAQVVVPRDAFVRLSVIEACTGTPAETLREAIAKGEMIGELKKRAWYTTIDSHDAWVKDGDTEEETTAKAEGRRDVRATGIGDVELLHPEEGPGRQAPESQGRAGQGQGRSESKPAKASRRRAKRCAPGKRVVTYDLG